MFSCTKSTFMPRSTNSSRLKARAKNPRPSSMGSTSTIQAPCTSVSTKRMPSPPDAGVALDALGGEHPAPVDDERWPVEIGEQFREPLVFPPPGDDDDGVRSPNGVAEVGHESDARK